MVRRKACRGWVHLRALSTTSRDEQLLTADVRGKDLAVRTLTHLLFLMAVTGRCEHDVEEPHCLSNNKAQLLPGTCGLRGGG